MNETYHQINNIPVKVIQGQNGIFKVFPVNSNGLLPVYYGNGLTETEALWRARNNIYNYQSRLNNLIQ